jgi:hypothetical protein
VSTSGDLPLSGDPPAIPGAAPCSGAQQAAAHHCADAARLAAAAQSAVDELRGARRQRAEIARAFETDGRLGDRRALSDAKAQARQAYRAGYESASDDGQLRVVTSTWLNEVSRLNRESRRATLEAGGLARRQADIDAIVERLELAADAARIAAASARERCMDARRALAACEEAHDARRRERRPVAVAAPAGSPAAGPPMALGHAPQLSDPTLAMAEPAVVALLRGDRRMLQSVVSRLAEEIGEDAGRLQLLMLDLRDAIITAGRSAGVFNFPPRHPFWGQFSLAEGRAMAAALATLNRRFDGRDGWDGGQAAQPRELAMAISLAGRDPRSVRPYPSVAELETLWQGTTVAAAEFLFANAPDLRLEGMIGLLGARADALAELWDNWGRLRPMLLGNEATLS